MTEDKIIVFYTDDDPEDLEIFCDIIEELRANVTVYTMTKAQELLHKLQHPPPVAQILFLDINMPGINGFEVLEQLRADKQFATLPVVVFSTSDDPVTIERTRALGASYFVPKSSNFTTLKNSISHVIGIDWASYDSSRLPFVYE